MAKIDKSKTPIFDAMARDLANVRPGSADEILCSMCLQKFGRGDLKTLTKEHVLSRALGGKATILSCKPCNNVAGYKVQGHLKTLLQMNEGFRGNGDFLGNFTLFGKTVPVGFQMSPGTGVLVTARGGGPQSLAAIESGLRSGESTKWAAQFKVPYSPGKASAGIARAAYLSAFFHFGYEYILSQAPSLFRAEVVSAMDVHSDRLCLLTGKMGIGHAPNENEPESVILPVELENGFKFFLSLLRFQRNRNYWMFSALPHKGQPSDSMFADLGDAVVMLGSYDVRMEGQESGEISVQLRRRE